MKRGVTKEEIIHATQELIARNGIRAVRVDEIAQTLGISKRTLYEMFTDKNDLVSACLDAMSHQQRERIVACRKRRGGKLAQRKAGGAIRIEALDRQRRGARGVHGKEAGLGVEGAAQLLLGGGKALIRRAGTDGIRQVEHLAGGGRAFVKLLAHARILCALSGKDKGYFTH